MQQTSKNPCWRLWLGALVLGVLVIAAVVGLDVFLSSDLRFVYVVGAVLLFCGAVWLGQKRRDWFAALFLVLPSLAGFMFYLLKWPGLWPNDVLWIAVVAVGTLIVDLARKQRVFASVLIVALLVGSGWYCLSYAPNELARSSSRVKKTSAPTFTLVPLSDGASTGAKPGKILVIDFFSTVCAPCIAELPEIAAARSDLSSNSNVEFVLVASDRFVGNDTPERFRAFAQRRRLTLPLAFDPEGKAHDSFGLTGVPALVILDRTGRVRFTHEGYNSAEKNFRRDLVGFIKTL
jgi:thiol-disulfide isomerase/thioredoxin